MDNLIDLVFGTFPSWSHLAGAVSIDRLIASWGY